MFVCECNSRVFVAVEINGITFWCKSSAETVYFQILHINFVVESFFSFSQFFFLISNNYFSTNPPNYFKSIHINRRTITTRFNEKCVQIYRALAVEMTHDSNMVLRVIFYSFKLVRKIKFFQWNAGIHKRKKFHEQINKKKHQNKKKKKIHKTIDQITFD